MRKIREPKILQAQPRKLIGFTVYDPSDLGLLRTINEAQDALEENIYDIVMEGIEGGASLDEVKAALSKDGYIRGSLLAVHQYTEVGSEVLVSDGFLEECRWEFLKHKNAREEQERDWLRRKEEAALETYKELYNKFEGMNPNEKDKA